jgi:hypothetical protein
MFGHGRVAKCHRVEPGGDRQRDDAVPVAPERGRACAIDERELEQSCAVEVGAVDSDTPLVVENLRHLRLEEVTEEQETRCHYDDAKFIHSSPLHGGM